MPSQLILIFRKDEMQQLMDRNPDSIVARAVVEEGTLNDGSLVGVIRVYADAMQDGSSEPLLTIEGCPEPPCKTH